MGIREDIYNHSPIFLQHAMTSGMGFIQNHQRYSDEYYNYLNFLEKFNKLSYNEKLDYQFQMFKELVLFANENCKFYRELYKGIDLNAINNFEDAKVLPFIDKELIRKNIDDICTINGSKFVEGHTGGTTGISLVVKFTEADFAHRMASLDYFKNQAGFDNIRMRKASFTCRSIVPTTQKKKVFWRYNKFSNQILYSSFHLSQNNLKYYVDSLNKFQPQAIDGLFSAMCDVASYILRNNIKLTFKPISVFPTCETITDYGRELLEKAFRCKVYNQYASSEGAPFITECPEGKLHFNMDSGYIEYVDNDSKEIAVTSFTTHGTPLIRYRIGDSMTFSTEESCSCGNESLIVESIDGRRTAYIYASDGSKITEANASSLFKHAPNVIIQSQLIQNVIGEVDMLMVVDENHYNKETHEKIISDEFYTRFGKETKLNIKYVDYIPREKSAKYKLVINNVDK